MKALRRLRFRESSFERMSNMSIVNCPALSECICEEKSLKSMIMLRLVGLAPDFAFYVKQYEKEPCSVLNIDNEFYQPYNRQPPEDRANPLFPSLQVCLIDGKCQKKLPLLYNNMEKYGVDRVYVVMAGAQPFT